MPVEVFRCSHCGREVLVRAPGPLSREEAARRVEEEMRPSARGASGRLDGTMRLRDHIWESVSATREEVPRQSLPRRCPACRRSATLLLARSLG